MISKISYIYFLLRNNLYFLNFNFKKIKSEEYNQDFTYLCFFDSIKAKKILFNKINKFKNFDEDYNTYASFDWINIARNIGGPEVVKITRDKILYWSLHYNKLYTYFSKPDLTSKRLLNLIYHFDFYGASASDNDKTKINFVIYVHYIFLKKIIKVQKKSSHQLIEIKKSILLFEAFNKIKTTKIIEQIKKSLLEDISISGIHFSMSPQKHSEYINHLVEIKSICLYFNLNTPDEINFQIINMISALKNFVHKDNTLAYFNGSNNVNIDKIFKILNYERDIKIKNLKNNKNGISVYENKNLKIIFDVVYPFNKLLNYGFHSSSHAFELSIGNEKNYY